MSPPTRRRKTTARAPARLPRHLTRDKVIAGAVALIDRAGADAVSLRGVAAVLGVTPMALYNHFSSKRDLLAAVAERVIGTETFDGSHAQWRDQVQHCFDILRQLCLRHPGLPRMLEFADVAPASVFAPMDITVRALRDAGLDDVNSVRTYFLLVGFTLTQTAYQTRPIPELEPSDRIRTERIAGRGYMAAERLALPSAWDFDASFAFGMSLVLNGVEATVSGLRRTTTPKPGPKRKHKR